MRKLIAVLLVGGVAGVSASCPSGGTLFFSQFQEATSGNNKYYQIYNPTDASIDLTTYSIGYCVNGCGTTTPTFEYGQPFAAGATIAAGGTYSVCNAGLGDTS